MVQAALNQIQQTEERMQALIHDTKENAENMVSEAQNKAKQRHEELMREYRVKAEEMRQAAAQTCKENSEKFSEQTKQLGEELEHKLFKRQNEAVDMVIRILMGQS